MLKNFSVGCFGVFLLLPVLSLAQKAPANANASGGQLLGMVEGVVHFCDKVNPQSASAYSQVDKLFTNGQSAKTLAQVRNADAYEDAFSKIDKQLRALSNKEASAVCNAH